MFLAHVFCCTSWVHLLNDSPQPSLSRPNPRLRWPQEGAMLVGWRLGANPRVVVATPRCLGEATSEEGAPTASARNSVDTEEPG